jgi:methyl-accepting chemotaxis protein-2 (aspartate sensor receptor)
MFTTIQPTRSLAQRVSLIGAGGLALVLLSVSIFMSINLTARERLRIAAAVGEKANAIADGVDAVDASSRVLVEKFYTSFASSFAPGFTLDKSDGTLSNNGEKLNGNFAQVDAFAKSSGGVATVFARQGEDFIRVTTSVRKENGERAMGTLLDRKHPAYAAMLEAKPFVGRAALFGKPYMTRYEPIRQGNDVIGILFIGFDLTAFQTAVEKLASDTRFFETGGVYVIDPKKSFADATFVVHPTARGKKVLEVFANAGKFLEELDKAPGGVLHEASPLLGAAGGDPFAIVRKSKATGWWVVAEVSDREAMKEHWASMTLIWGAMAAATLALAVGLLWLIRKWVSRPLLQLSAAVTCMAAGDMTRPSSSDSTDEIGQLIRDVENMRRRLSEVLRQVRQTAESVATGSAEIAMGNVDLSQRTEEQAANLQQTSSSMVQLSTTISHNSETAVKANELANDARGAATNGGAVVNQVVGTMHEIAQSSNRIGSIIGVIDGIAFQTNILALNAAVEAARAGDQGRGFAVVASEVRSLAQRSAQAAKEIKALVNESVAKVENGSKLVDDAGRSMEDIVRQVSLVTDLIAEISAASGQQTQSIAQVSDAVLQLDNVTQQNASLVEESAAAANSLKQQAAMLVESVAVFSLSNEPVH